MTPRLASRSSRWWPRRGIARPLPTAALDTSRGCDAAKRIRKAPAKRVDGVAITQFYDRCRFDVDRDGLTIVAPSQFTQDYMRNDTGRDTQLAMHDVLGSDTHLRWTLEIPSQPWPTKPANDEAE